MTNSTRPEKADPAAFDLPGAGKAAALCLHGLTGTPYEVRSLGEALADALVQSLLGIEAVASKLFAQTHDAVRNVFREEGIELPIARVEVGLHGGGLPSAVPRGPRADERRV